MISKKIVILGKSASGKDHLINYLEKRGLKRNISYTTRPMRIGEKDGVTYKFVTTEEFEHMIEKDVLIEYHKFNNWYYGNTTRDFDKSDVCIKTVYGLNQISSRRDECFVIYIDIDKDIRKKRLLERKDSNDSIERRIEADEEDFKDFTNYDLRITDSNYNPEEIYNLIIKL